MSGSRVRRRSATYKRIARCAVGADLYTLADRRARSLLVWIHGGALIGGSRRDLAAHQLAGYLEAGFAVLSIDYRLAPETHLPFIVGDALDGYGWAVGEVAAELGIGPDRVAVAGHSAGGYLALTLGQRGVPRPAAIVSFHGYGDILGSWYTEPDAWYLGQPYVSETEARDGIGDRVVASAVGEERWRFYRYCRQHGAWVREVAGPDLRDDLPALEAYCPARNVTPAFPPTMLVHGTVDTDVPLGEATRMADALRRSAIDHELLTVEDRGHMFDTDASDPVAVTTFEAALAFLRTRIGLAGLCGVAGVSPSARPMRCHR